MAGSRWRQVSASRRSPTADLRGGDRQESLDVLWAAVERRGKVRERDAARDQQLEDAGPLSLGLLKMLHAHFEVAAVGVHGAKRHPVAEDHLQVDNVRRDLDTA